MVLIFVGTVHVPKLKTQNPYNLHCRHSVEYLTEESVNKTKREGKRKCQIKDNINKIVGRSTKTDGDEREGKLEST